MDMKRNKNYFPILIAAALIAVMYLTAYGEEGAGGNNTALQVEQQTEVASDAAETAGSHQQSAGADEAESRDAFAQFRNSFTGAVDEILQEVHKNYPALDESFDDAKRNKLLAKFAASLGPGITYLPPGKEKPSAAGEEENRKETAGSDEALAVLLQGKIKILYFYPGNFSNNALEKLRKRIEQPPDKDQSVKGIILDLRNSQGYNYRNIEKTVSILLPPEKLELLGIVPGKRSKRRFPIAVLGNKKTLGAPEVLISILLQTESAVFFGTETAGHPFPAKKYMLKSGGLLLIPQIPEKLTMIPVRSVTPSIKSPVNARVSAEVLKKNPADALKDTCIRKAVDLIVCVAALNRTEEDEGRK